MNQSLKELKAHFRQLAGIKMPDYRIEGDTVVASKTCDVTGEPYIVRMPLDAYQQWRNDVPAQIAFSHLTDDEREFLINGQTPAECRRRLPSDSADA